jgi:hypothetical protein
MDLQNESRPVRRKLPGVYRPNCSRDAAVLCAEHAAGIRRYPESTGLATTCAAEALFVLVDPAHY